MSRWFAPLISISVVFAAASMPLQAFAEQISAPGSTQDEMTGVPSAGSPSLCGTRNAIVSKLAEHYQEAPQAVGVVDKDAVLEVFVSNNGTWTILATGTDGNSCVLSSGEGWQSTTFVAGKDA